MPCYKCSNGKYKYGQRGKWVFDTLTACQAAEAAIHARENAKKKPKNYSKDLSVIDKNEYYDLLTTEDCILDSFEGNK